MAAMHTVKKQIVKFLGGGAVAPLNGASGIKFGIDTYF